jgi:hypothetical protein
MTLKSAPYFWVECDTCGIRAEYGDFSAMSDASSAIDGAVDSEWSTQGERHHCPACPHIADCYKCGKDAGENAMERDDHCQACWDAAEAGSAELATEGPS